MQEIPDFTAALGDAMLNKQNRKWENNLGAAFKTYSKKFNPIIPVSDDLCLENSHILQKKNYSQHRQSTTLAQSTSTPFISQNHRSLRNQNCGKGSQQSKATLVKPADIFAWCTMTPPVSRCIKHMVLNCCWQTYPQVQAIWVETLIILML